MLTKLSFSWRLQLCQRFHEVIASHRQQNVGVLDAVRIGVARDGALVRLRALGGRAILLGRPRGLREGEVGDALGPLQVLQAIVDDPAAFMPRASSRRHE